MLIDPQHEGAPGLDFETWEGDNTSRLVAPVSVTFPTTTRVPPVPRIWGPGKALDSPE